MRKVVAETLDSLADYVMVEAEVPEPGAGEVLVKVAACGMGYVDALIATGRYQVRPPLPFTPGQEIAGTLSGIGGNVHGLSEGDRVMATVFGQGLSEFAIVPASAIRKLPDNMTFEQAAVFGINYLTAMHGLRQRATLQAGERLLVFGSAGGVGCAAVQVGRLLGAEVIAVASTAEKRAFAASHGANATIDTDPDGWRERLKSLCDGRGPDVIFDPVCGPLFEQAFRSLNWRGRHLVVGFAGGPIPRLPANLSLLKGASLVGVDVRQYLAFESDRAAELMADLLEWVEQGDLVAPVGRIFPFAHYAAAMTHASSGQGLGKAVIRVIDGIL